MALTRLKLRQLEPSTNPGSLVASDASNNMSIVSPTLGADHLWFYDHSATALVPLIVGSNLSISGTTLNASAGAGGYAEVQEEGVALTARTKLNFIGSGITAVDNAGSTRTDVSLDATLNALAAYNTNGILTQTSADTFVGRTLTGTTNRLTVTNGDGVAGAPTFDISTAYVGQASITTLGTITTGVWTGTAIAAVNGGTGQTVYAVGDLLSASTTTALSRVAAVASGSVLKSAGVSTLPVWGTLASTDLSNSSNIALLNAVQTFTNTNTFSNNITVNATPSASTDVVTVGYLNNIVANGLKYHSVRAATTATQVITARTTTTLTVGGTSYTVDGQTMANGEYVLIKNDTSGVGGAGSADNGAYLISGIGSSVLLTRATYMDAAGEIDAHTFVIEDGTTNIGTIWITTSEVATLGTDAIVFSQLQTSGTVTGTGVNNQIAVWSGTGSLDGNSTFTWDQTQMTVGTATPATSARVTTQGTGTGNTTFGLQHNNSSAAQVFRVADDGTTVIGTGTTSTLTGNSFTTSGAWSLTAGGVVNMTPGANFNILTGGAQVIGIGANSAFTTTSGTTDVVRLTGVNFAPTSGTGVLNFLNLSGTVNQTGGANGISRGILIAPTLTAGAATADYRGIEITANSSHYALWTTAGKVRFDFGSDATGDIPVRSATGELTRLAAGATAGHVLTSNGTGTLPTYQAAATTTVTRAYLTGSTSSVIDLDLGTSVTDIDGTNVVFATIGVNVEKIFVVRNGVTLSRSGTVSRDYTLDVSTGVLTLAYALTTDESLMVYKIV